MKKAKKILLTVLPVLMLALVVFVSFGSNILAASTSSGISTDFPQGAGEIGTVTGMTNKVWGTVLTILQILAFAAVVIAGVRYMFASADQKADIKKGLVYLVIGAILVFATSAVVKVVVDAANEATGTATIEMVQEIEKV